MLVYYRGLGSFNSHVFLFLYIFHFIFFLVCFPSMQIRVDIEYHRIYFLVLAYTWLCNLQIYIRVYVLLYIHFISICDDHISFFLQCVYGEVGVNQQKKYIRFCIFCFLTNKNYSFTKKKLSKSIFFPLCTYYILYKYAIMYSLCI